MKIDVIIPTYKPDKRFLELIKRLALQSTRPNKIIIINTSEYEWKESGINKYIFEESGIDIELYHIDIDEFDHGDTRNLGISRSDAELFVCMTQDAIPYDKNLLKELKESIGDDIGLAYARQIAYSNASLIEKYTRQYNYPDKDIIKGIDDINKYGIKTYFASNVCAIYKREIFDKLGGFIKKTILNEDMLYAYKLINQGYKIKYISSAKVLHSHNYTGFEQFRRNFDIGVSQDEHKDVFSALKSESEGIKLVKDTSKYLLDNKAWYLIPRLIYISACKYLGFFLGKRYKKLPKKIVLRLALNKNYFKG